MSVELFMYMFQNKFGMWGYKEETILKLKEGFYHYPVCS